MLHIFATLPYFYYSYTQGLKKHYKQLNQHILNSKCGFDEVWKTKYLDSRFGSRIPRRADSMDQYDWLGISHLKGDYIAYLSRSGGRKHGDNYDIFPEVQSDSDGYYIFNFSLEGLIENIEREKSVFQAFNCLKLHECVEVRMSEVTPTNYMTRSSRKCNYVYYNDLKLGRCPEYINHLLGLPICQQKQAYVEYINHYNEIYGRGIIIKLQVKFNSSPWHCNDFQPLNKMIA